MDNAFTSYPIEDRSYVSYVKREIHTMILRHHFSEQQAGEIDIIVSELSSNLIKHARSGELLYRIYDFDEDNSMFEIVAIDKGPGMSDPDKMMKDGISTTMTLGHGLGAIKRLSDVSQVYSIPAWGTLVYAMVTTLKNNTVRKQGLDIDIRCLCVNKPREQVCGDGYRIKRNESHTQIFFGDGLGHGEYAKAAIDEAGDFFSTCKETEPVDIIRQMHERVRRTRGLVASVVVVDKKAQEWKICGVGNISARMYTGIEYRNYLSYNGTVGHNIPTSMKNSIFPIEKNQYLIMNSDGIKSRWDLGRYPSIFKYDNTLVAAAVYSDFSRRTDDSSILIAKVS